ncbi:hypothetical protein FRC00_007708, partial [Tulasnella sp. 408]
VATTMLDATVDPECPVTASTQSNKLDLVEAVDTVNSGVQTIAESSRIIDLVEALAPPVSINANAPVLPMWTK